jgi:hypothetical protein
VSALAEVIDARRMAAAAKPVIFLIGLPLSVKVRVVASTYRSKL